jgi:predicted nucleic acid-binding protein
VTSITNAALVGLDIGEREAIQLALELGITTLLLDETEGRKQAEKLHLEVRGTLGMLERAAKLGVFPYHNLRSVSEQAAIREETWAEPNALRR